MILQKELKEVKEIHVRQKEQASGKRYILKNKIIMLTEEVHKALETAEKATAAKKAKKRNKYKRPKRKIASDSKEESFLEDPDDFHNSDNKILDYIVVED